MQEMMSKWINVKGVIRYIMDRQNSDGGYTFCQGTDSSAEDTYYAIEVLKAVNVEPKFKERTIQFLKGLQNSDGSFGGRGYSKLASTWHALATLKLLGYNVFHLHETLKWIRGCEASNGGFVRNPNSLDNYILIDSIYHGVKSLEIFNETCKYPFQTVSLISKFQNRNGGFRKSIFLGISTFENTYYAVFSLQTILKWMNKK